jgi:hypothetical protein
VISVAFLTTQWAVGYFALGNRAMDVPASDTQLPIDSWIPYCGCAVWPYLLAIVGIALPAWLLRKRELFRRTFIAKTIVIGISFCVFFLFPTRSLTLRSYATIGATDRVTAWLLDFLFWIDVPANLAPSLHVSLMTTSALALAIERTAARACILAVWSIFLASVCLVKQHYLFDVVSGAALGLVAFQIAGLSNKPVQR